MLASILAALTVIIILPPELEPENSTNPLDFPQINILMNEFSGFILEFMGSLIVTWVYFNMLFDKRTHDSNIYAFAIGSAYYLSFLCFGNLTGACVNPMKHFGPALLSGSTDNLWVYYLGPLFGTFFAGFYYTYSILNDDDLDDGRKHFEPMNTTHNLNEAMNLEY